MSEKSIIALASLLVVAGAVGIGYIGYKNFVSPLCANEMLETIASQDQQHVATLYTRDCGATTAVNVNVSLDDKKIFTADNYARDIIDILWESNDRLKIEYRGSDTDIFKYIEYHNGVHIDLAR